MKRIAHIVNSNIYSGLEKVAVTIMQQMKDSYNMVYVTKSGPIIEVLKEKEIPYYIIESMSRKEIKKFIKEWKPDIIHAHDYTASVVCSSVKSKLPLIEHIHNNCLWIKKICLKSLAFLYAGLNADKILTVSDSIKNEFIFSKFIEQKVIKVSNPVSCSEVLERAGKLDNINKEYDICCTGRITQQKAPERFVKIIQELKKEKEDIKAVWIGSGELFEKVKNLIKEEKLEKNIELIGYQSNPYEIMKKCKLFMLTSKWEGYGLVAFEALALGLPCVVSNVGGLPEIVDETCGKLCTEDEEFITEASKLLEDKEYYDRKCKFSIKRARALDNIEIYMKNIEKIYDGETNE